MFDAAAVGTGIQIGATNLVPSVSVVNGIFTVQLDFTETSFSGANVFVILIKDRIDLFDTVIFAGIFAAYIWRVSKLPKDDDVESTLSGLSLRKFLSQAKAANFRIRVYFVYLDSAELCVRRVAGRVARGGHHVPPEDIRRRFERSNKNFWNVYKESADGWYLFFNAGEGSRQIAAGDEKDVIIYDEARFEEWLKIATN